MPIPETTEDSYALIGAGPAGLAGARNLDRAGIDFVGFEAHTGVGGLWDIDNPRSTVYRSAHLISSRTTTAYAEFPMREDVPDYPDHREMKVYFDDFAEAFDLRRRYRFGTAVQRVEPDGELWSVTSTGPDGERTERFRGVVIATGTLSEPSIPTFEGELAGELMHTAAYKDPEIFKGKRVLIIGAGNSGCDIAVDAVHQAACVDMSVRSGYWFIPKYIFGRPADTLNQRRKPLPAWLKTKVDGTLLKLLTGDPSRFGFIKPDHRVYETHPILNTLVLHHAGHGDIKVRGDVARFAGDSVEFEDGTSREYDLVVLATGYKLHYPFVDPEHLSWVGNGPDLYLNIFTPRHRNLFVLGMLEAAGIGWQGRYLQAELVARFLHAERHDPAKADALWRRVHGPRPDLSGGYRYRQLDRMPYYVNKDAYTRAVQEHLSIVAPA